MTASAPPEGADADAPSADRRADRLILRGAFSTGFGFLIRLGARVLFLVVAGHLFGAALFGAYAIAVAVLEALVGFAGLSLKKTLFQFLDRDADANLPPSHILIDAVLLVLAASALCAALLMLGATLLPHSVLAEGTAHALFWIAPMIAGQALVDILFAATRWRHAIRHEVIGRSLVEPYALLAGTAAAYALGFRESGLIIGYWIGNVAVNLYALTAVRRCFPDFVAAGYRPDRLRAMARRLLPNTWSEFVTAIAGRVDLYLVGILLGERWAGIYGMAQQVRTPLRQVRQSFDGLLVPMVSKTLAARGAQATAEALASAARLILSIQLAFLLLIVAIGAPLLDLFGPGFAAGYTALVILTLAEAVQGTLGLGDLLLVYLRPRTGLTLTIVAFGLGVAGAVLLISPLGIAGAALAMLLASCVQSVLRRVALRMRLAIRAPLRPLLPPLLAGVAGLAAIAVVGRLAASDALAAIASLLVYGIVLAAALRAIRESLAIKGFVSSRDKGDDAPRETAGVGPLSR